MKTWYQNNKILAHWIVFGILILVVAQAVAYSVVSFYAELNEKDRYTAVENKKNNTKKSNLVFTLPAYCHANKDEEEADKWLINCGSEKNRNARATMGEILKNQGWTMYDYWGVNADFCKNNIRVGVSESEYIERGFKVSQREMRERFEECTNPAPTTVATSTWKTYRNEKYGFEFKYPGEWYLSVVYSQIDKPGVSEQKIINELNRGVSNIGSVPEDEELTVRVDANFSEVILDPDREESSRQYLVDIKKEIDSKPIGARFFKEGDDYREEVKIISVSGLKARRALLHSYQWGGFSATLELFKNNSTYIELETYLLSDPAGSNSGKPEDEKRNKDFDIIVSSFKFL